MSLEKEKSLAAFPWGIAILALLVVIYAVIAIQVPLKVETGVRVIPWQAPDLEIQSPLPVVESVDPVQN